MLGPSAVQAQTMNKTVITNQRMVRHSVSSVTSTTTSRPLPYSVTVIEKKGCRINGHFYEVGQRVNSASNPCLDCRCAPNGLMSCSPIVSVSCSQSVTIIMYFCLFFLEMFHSNTPSIPNESELFQQKMNMFSAKCLN